MSEVIEKYLAYRQAIEDLNQSASEDNTHVLQTKKLFEDVLPTCKNPLEPDANGYSLLSCAILFSEEDVVIKILSQLNKTLKTDRTTIQLLSDAVAGGNNAILKLLCQCGIDINQPDKGGRTQLAISASNADLKSCMLLLECGADIEAINQYYGSQNIFDYAFASKKEMSDKITVLNFLSIWCWSKNIAPDLSNSKFDAEIIKHIFMIGAKLKSFELSSTRTDFIYAYSNMDALLSDARTDKYINFKELYLALKHCLDAGNDNPDIIDKLEKVKLIWTKKESDNPILFTLFYRPNLIDLLPRELKEKAKQQEVELELKSPQYKK